MSQEATHPGGKLVVSLTGTASAVVVQQFSGDAVQPNAITGKGVNTNYVLRRIVLRGTGTITAADIKIVDGNYAVSNGMTYTSIPGEYIVASWTAVPVAASATVPFLDDTVLELPRISSSCAVVANVTSGAGGWAIVGRLDTER